MKSHLLELIFVFPVSVNSLEKRYKKCPRFLGYESGGERLNCLIVMWVRRSADTSRLGMSLD